MFMIAGHFKHLYEHVFIKKKIMRAIDFRQWICIKSNHNQWLGFYRWRSSPQLSWHTMTIRFRIIYHLAGPMTWCGCRVAAQLSTWTVPSAYLCWKPEIYSFIRRPSRALPMFPNLKSRVAIDSSSDPLTWPLTSVLEAFHPVIPYTALSFYIAMKTSLSQCHRRPFILRVSQYVLWNVLLCV